MFIHHPGVCNGALNNGAISTPNPERQPAIQNLNQYRCPVCGTEWQDQWDCGCNDRCPRCRREIVPYASVAIRANAGVVRA